jgi:hypothetical protein
MDDEKDRLGDKLRDKGKAAEDLYIAEQERLRLERLRQKATAEVRLGVCPKDGSTLTKRRIHEAPVDVCPTCRGIWLVAGELEEILRREDEAWVTRWLRSVLEH